MTPNDVTDAVNQLNRATARLRKALRGLRIWTICAVAGVVLALCASGLAMWDVHHGAGERARLRCADATAHIQVTNDAIDDVLGAIESEVKADPAAMDVIRQVRLRADAHLAAELAALPAC